VIDNLSCRIERYGLTADAGKNPPEWRAHEITQTEDFLTFSLTYRQAPLGRIASPLIGLHNLENTLAVIALCHHLGLSWEAIQEGIRTFQGIKRRQEIVGAIEGILIIDDFAHHPTAVAETLAALKLRYPARRLWAVFEPRSASSRRKVFQNAFAMALQGADYIVVSGLYRPETVPEALRISPEAMVKTLNSVGKMAVFIPSSDQIVLELGNRLKPGDVVCIMSCGGFGGIHQKLLQRLRQRFPEASLG